MLGAGLGLGQRIYNYALFSTLDEQQYFPHVHTYTIRGGQSDSKKDDNKVCRDDFPDKQHQ